ncbi:MAG: glycosyltransferase family 9 protein [Planctomycetes bacterium]|nr:glycosyltransferase family 9 protein [Planctomycetota bacterium]
MSCATILIVKTGALGDVLRTTSILPGLREQHPDAEIVWVTAPAARELLELNDEVDELLCVDPKDAAAVAALVEELREDEWDWVISLDDEQPLCALATELGKAKLSGAHLDAAGERVYSADTAPWFDMGLLSVHGKQEADRLKVANTRSHPEIYAAMLGIEMGRPELELPIESFERAAAFARERGLVEVETLIGLNTGAGGRWTSKSLPEEVVVELAGRIAAALPGPTAFLVLGGPDERERNARILAGLESAGLVGVDGGTDNTLFDFAAIVDLCDLLVTSDSLALHVGVAREVPIVAFFAPTSEAEIELYGLGEKVRSTAPDYCSYRPDADNSTLTAERLAAAVFRVLADGEPRSETED